MIQNIHVRHFPGRYFPSLQLADVFQKIATCNGVIQKEEGRAP